MFGDQINKLIDDGIIQLSDIESIKDKAQEKIQEQLNTLFNKN
jgi:hypothetical protein